MTVGLLCVECDALSFVHSLTHEASYITQSLKGYRVVKFCLRIVENTRHRPILYLLIYLFHIYLFSQ